MSKTLSKEIMNKTWFTLIKKEKLTLIKKDEIVKKWFWYSANFEYFFSNIASNLKITEYANYDPILDNINNTVLDKTGKYVISQGLVQKTYWQEFD